MKAKVIAFCLLLFVWLAVVLGKTFTLETTSFFVLWCQVTLFVKPKSISTLTLLDFTIYMFDLKILYIVVAKLPLVVSFTDSTVLSDIVLPQWFQLNSSPALAVRQFKKESVQMFDEAVNKFNTKVRSRLALTLAFK